MRMLKTWTLKFFFESVREHEMSMRIKERKCYMVAYNER